MGYSALDEELFHASSEAYKRGLEDAAKIVEAHAFIDWMGCSEQMAQTFRVWRGQLAHAIRHRAVNPQ